MESVTLLIHSKAVSLFVGDKLVLDRVIPEGDGVEKSAVLADAVGDFLRHLGELHVCTKPFTLTNYEETTPWDDEEGS